jgi:FecR protein
MFGVAGLRPILAMALVVGASSGALAEDGAWSVGKSSGEVWVTTSGAEQTSLNQQEVLKPGDTIRTGRNGRVLLLRGEETILVAPNSVIGLPEQKKDGLSTTILQQAGSILLDVEKRNVKHFEVETPYLAAVVKGTQFSVTVGAASTSVEVRRGLVEVSDFKSGDVAQVMPGQAATLFAHGKSGLTLSGSGAFNPIEHGLPRAPSIQQIPVPRGGLPAPRNAANGTVIHALGNAGPDFGKSTLAQRRAAEIVPAKRHVVRISTTLGEAKLNVAKATHGLAREAVTPGLARSTSAKDTVWSDAKASLNGAAGSQGNSSGNSIANGNGATGNSAAASSIGAAAVSPIATAATEKNGNGNAATGNGNSGNGSSGNGNSANANNGNGNSGNGNGNGNGNGGVGNGNGNGNAKH